MHSGCVEDKSVIISHFTGRSGSVSARTISQQLCYEKNMQVGVFAQKVRNKQVRNKIYWGKSNLRKCEKQINFWE